MLLLLFFYITYLVHDAVDLLFVGLDTDNAVLGERVGGIRDETNRLDQVLDHDRLEDVELIIFKQLISYVLSFFFLTLYMSLPRIDRWNQQQRRRCCYQ